MDQLKRRRNQKKCLEPLLWGLESTAFWWYNNDTT